jgi:hypothetical protein
MQTISPEEASKDATQNIQKAQIEERKILDEQQHTIQNAKRLRAYVQDISNPSPIIMAVIFISIILILWGLHRIFVRPNASGEWFDEDGNQWIISQNRFTGKVKVRFNGRWVYGASIEDNLFRVSRIVGIWDYGNNILLVGGGRLSKVRR